MISIIAVIIRIISNSLSNVFQKRLTQCGMNSLSVNCYTYIGLSLICLFFVNHIAEITAPVLVNAIAGGIFGAAGNYCLIKALSRGDLSVLGPINAYKPLTAMIFAILLAGEIPSLAGLLGIVLLIAGSYVIFSTTREGFSLELFKRKDIRYRIFALILTAIEAVFIKNVISNSDILTSFILWSFFGAFFAAILQAKHKIKFKFPDKLSLLKLIFVITFAGIMQYSTNIVFERMNVSYALALFQLSAVLNVILGWKIFKEKDLIKKLAGSIIMVSGAVIIIIFH